MFDDKGLSVVCALGLPPMRHGDDPLRAVHAALDITQNIKLVSPGATTKIGVTTGRAFCGIVGHPQLRREYTMMGTVINLCARLMSAANSENPVLVDEITQKVCAIKQDC